MPWLSSAKKVAVFSVLGLIGLLLFAEHGLTANLDQMDSSPPKEYHLSDCSIQAIRYSGGPSRSVTRVTLYGTGNATIDTDNTASTIHFSPTEFVQILNELYRIKFFEIPSDYINQHSVSLSNGGTIRTRSIRLMDTDRIEIRCNIGEYKKSVLFSNHTPTDLVKVATRILQLK